jgi:adenylate cyclase
MPRNIEIKARIDDFDATRRRAAEIADEGPIEIAQDDTFFPCNAGRLKLRVLAEDRGELIFYRRADETGPKESSYRICPTAAPEVLRETLAAAYGTAGRVRKRRTLFLAGRTRIHLDEVEGLGDFLELEVVLEEGEPAERGGDEAHRLMDALGVDRSRLVSGAYVDLLASENEGDGRAPSPAPPRSCAG